MTKTTEATQNELETSARWDLPRVRTPMEPAGVVAALDRAARRGGLPGFETEGPGDFRVACFGSPFDRELVATISQAPDGSRIEFVPRLLRKAPVVMLASVIVSIWPGLPLVDAVIPSSWGWWPTWTWYLPLVIVPTVLSAPALWRKSEVVAARHAREQIETIARRTEGEVEGVGEPSPIRTASPASG